MKRTIRPPQRRATLVFAPSLHKGMLRSTDKRILPFDRAEAALNVDTRSGALRPAYGVSDTSLAYERVYYFSHYNEETDEREGMLLGFAGGTVYVHGETPSAIEGVTFSSPPSGTNYRLYGEDVFLLCGEEGMAVIHADGTAVTVDAPRITGLAMHNERMFVTIGGRKNAVWFSDDLDPTNWNPTLDEGGFIELEGEGGAVNKVVDFGGYVYIFRDYGIYRLAAYGSQTEFSLTGLFVSSGRIFADTVCVCGDRILFCADDGPYVFDGLSTTRILRSFDGAFAPLAPVAAYSGGMYFLATRRAESEQTGNDALLCIDPKTGEACLSADVHVAAFSPVRKNGGEALYCKTERATLGQVVRGATYYGTPLKCVWRGSMTDLGVPDREKLLGALFIDTAAPLSVRVFTERGERLLHFTGKPGVQQRRLNLTGTKAGLELTALGTIDAARPAIRFTCL